MSGPLRHADDPNAGNVTSVRAVDVDGLQRYEAWCTCGWKTEPTRDRKQARRWADAHADGAMISHANAHRAERKAQGPPPPIAPQRPTEPAADVRSRRRPADDRAGMALASQDCGHCELRLSARTKDLAAAAATVVEAYAQHLAAAHPEADR